MTTPTLELWLGIDLRDALARSTWRWPEGRRLADDDLLVIDQPLLVRLTAPQRSVELPLARFVAIETHLARVYSLAISPHTELLGRDATLQLCRRINRFVLDTGLLVRSRGLEAEIAAVGRELDERLPEVGNERRVGRYLAEDDEAELWLRRADGQIPAGDRREPADEHYIVTLRCWNDRIRRSLWEAVVQQRLAAHGDRATSNYLEVP